MTPRGTPTAPDASRWRLIVVFVAWVAAFGLLFGRLVDLQVFRARGLQRLAIGQQLESLKLPGRRGEIVDRAGRWLAVNVVVDSIYAIPRAIPDPAAFARAVAPGLHLAPAEVERRLRRAGPYFAWLA
ncbi:MAG TPA: hypothetical protein VJT32_08460, partial [bacterium]|nr:hypothetical protein [bacterium]